MKKSINIFLVFFIASNLWAYNGMRIIPLDSPLYDALDVLFLEEGIVSPSDDRPWTEGQFKTYLTYLNFSGMTKSGRELYSRIQKEVYPGRQGVKEKGGYTFKGGLVTNFEIFTVMNNAPGYKWMHNYKKRPSMVKIPLELWVNNSIYLNSTLEVKEESTADSIVGNHTNWVNFSEPQIDQYFPLRAFFSAGGPGWYIQFGRDKISWGNGEYGNLMLSDYPDDFDFFRLVTYWHPFSLSTIYISMDPFFPDGTPVSASSFIGHRLEYKPFPFLKLALSEAVSMIDKGTVETALQPIRDFNFLMIYHNWTVPNRTNSLLTGEVTLSPFKNFSIYGQFAVDEFVTPYEGERDGGGGPGVYGWIAGVRGVVDTGGGFVTYGLEGAGTSPWMYHRHDPPYFYDVHKYWSFVTDSYGYIVDPLGFREGPDARVLYLYGEYTVPFKYTLHVDFTFISKGETTIYTPYAAVAGDTSPMGIPENTLRLHGSGKYTLSDHFKLGIDLFYRTVINKDHILADNVYNNLEAALSIQWDL